MAFNGVGEVGEQLFVEYLATKKIEYRCTGVENWSATNTALHFCSDLTSKLLRFFPDYAITQNKRTYLVEVKDTRTISKQSYTQYMKLSKAGYTVLIALLDDTGRYDSFWFWQRVEKLKFMICPKKGLWRQDTGKPYAVIKLRSMNPHEELNKFYEYKANESRTDAPIFEGENGLYE